MAGTACDVVAAASRLATLVPPIQPVEPVEPAAETGRPVGGTPEGQGATRSSGVPAFRCLEQVVPVHRPWPRRPPGAPGRAAASTRTRTTQARRKPPARSTVASSAASAKPRRLEQAQRRVQCSRRRAASVPHTPLPSPRDTDSPPPRDTARPPPIDRLSPDGGDATRRARVTRSAMPLRWPHARAATASAQPTAHFRAQPEPPHDLLPDHPPPPFRRAATRNNRHVTQGLSREYGRTPQCSGNGRCDRRTAAPPCRPPR